MASILDKISTSDKNAFVIDIGQVYTKCGFSSNASPQQILPTSVIIDDQIEPVFEKESQSMIVHDDRLFKFLQSIFYKHNTNNSRNRRVIIIESIITPIHLRRLLANILFKQFNISSLLFLPSHLCATYTLGRNTALVLDIGYKEAQILPICECVPLAIQFGSLTNASQVIHKQIQFLLEEHAFITQEGRKRPFKSLNIQLPEDVLENIKIRCCFVSPYTRAQIFANKIPDNSFKEATTVIYPFGAHTNIHIPGIVREFACEVLFQDDIDGRSIVSLILDALIQAPIDFRQKLADNILIIGGTAMIPGFLHRFNDELIHLVNTSTYAKKLRMRKFRFHSPPSSLNCTAWLGGSLFGDLETAELQSIKRDKYLENHFLPDWLSD